ncbi:MAG: hypothetical protein EA374_00005 [Acholeplasmatales bacterium]|nr:MAG: hypothetical protein EA374_00005 [Acholeplasmatales bacterium]
MKPLGLVGSPKARYSTSAHLLGMLKKHLKEPPIQPDVLCRHAPLEAAVFDQVLTADCLVLSFPLYVDGIPGHLLRHLEHLTPYLAKRSTPLTVYALCNAGYYEGIQAEVALECVSHWCKRANIIYGGGIGIGAGTMLAFAKVPLFKNLRRHLNVAFETLAAAINNQTIVRDTFVAPNFPRFLYKIIGNRMWFKALSAHGLKKKALYRRP